MDPSIAIKPVFERFQSVIITSGVNCLSFVPSPLTKSKNLNTENTSDSNLEEDLFLFNQHALFLIF